MKQIWQKLGLVYCPSGERDWLHSHASVPIAEHIEGDIFRIYFSSRNEQQVSFTGYVVIDIMRPHVILELSKLPVLSPGNLGEFDDSGAMASWLVKRDNVKYLYYIGWNLGRSVPFRNSVGLAVSIDGQPFKRYASGPVLDRTMLEPHFVASCCVIPCEDKWRMWYLSCTKWSIESKKPQHHYHIKYAESVDGIYWKRDGLIAIDYENKSDFAISRPSVIHDKDCWKMWYSHRGSSYRIGYAESNDGVKWKRLDNLCGIDVSNSDWDSQMIEYPYVFDHNGSRFMLYNGSGYGKTGFGLAILNS